MTRFRNEIIIDRPIDEVFRFVANFENMPKWNYFVVDVHKVSRDPIGLGAVFHQRRKTDTQEYRITEFDHGRRVAVETLPPAPSLVMRFTLEARGTSTRLSDEWEFGVGGGLLGVLGSLAAGRIKAAVRENLAQLKHLLENREVRLQDGRVEKI
jgi:uncharacterized membrane protein